MNRVKTIKLLFAPILITGLLVFSEITLGHGTENHVEENTAVEQAAAASPDTTVPSGDPSVEAQQSRTDDRAIDADELDQA